MGSDLNITQELQDYILEHGRNLHPVQKEIIEYNTSLGDIKKMQISISQSQLLHLIIKVSNIKGKSEMVYDFEDIKEIIRLSEKYYVAISNKGNYRTLSLENYF